LKNGELLNYEKSIFNRKLFKEAEFFLNTNYTNDANYARK